MEENKILEKYEIVVQLGLLVVTIFIACTGYYLGQRQLKASMDLEVASALSQEIDRLESDFADCEVSYSSYKDFNDPSELKNADLLITRLSTCRKSIARSESRLLLYENWQKDPLTDIRRIRENVVEHMRIAITKIQDFGNEPHKESFNLYKVATLGRRAICSTDPMVGASGGHCEPESYRDFIDQLIEKYKIAIRKSF